MSDRFPLRPLRDRVIVKPNDAEEKTEGGIIIPENARTRPREGIVMASGNGLKDIPNETKPGDEVMYGQYAGTEITYNKEVYLIMHEADILVIKEK